MVLAVGLLVTAGLVWGAVALYNGNEDRLLRLRARELGLVLASTSSSLQTPLASAASLADATDGNPTRFRAFIAPHVGAGRSFVSASLWREGAAAPAVVVGQLPLLAASPARARRFMDRVRHSRVLSVTDLLAGRRLGYAFSTPGNAYGYVAYAENVLPPNRRSRIATNSAFDELHYVLYLGRSQTPQHLLVTDLSHLPPRARHASDAIAFGDRTLTLVVTPRTSLGGAFFTWLPWIIAVAGVLLTVAAAALTDRLAQGRRRAERLAGALDEIAEENRALYQEQRGIASVLQHALLPETLAALPGLEVAVRYEPGAADVEIGGDWYELVEAAEGCVLAIVGDVSGHDLYAATTMASLRHAALAYAAVDPSPAAVLERLSDLVARRPHRFFATVLCALIDVDAHELRIASAGHLPPLVIDEQRVEYVQMSIDVPVGAAADATYTETTVELRPQATVVTFTDGLVERRGESIDVGLERLRTAARAGRALALGDLVAKLANDLGAAESDDDTAILAVRWKG
jgi:serine phosphatase RsbU (regulator of sigma subunit)